MKAIIFFFLLLCTTSAVATEGARVDGTAGANANWSSPGRIVEAYYLCDGDHTAAAACAEFNLASVLAANQRVLGSPDAIQFYIYRQSANCTPTVTIIGRAVPTATAGATQVDHTIQALLGTGTSSFAPALTPLFPVYYATVSNDADCTDLEVVVALHYSLGNPK